MASVGAPVPRHHYVQTDEQEQEALALALALSLEESATSGVQRPPAPVSQRSSAERQQYGQPAPSYPPPQIQRHGPTQPAHSNQQPLVQQWHLPPAAAAPLPAAPPAGAAASQQQQWRPARDLLAPLRQFFPSGCAGCGQWLGFGAVVSALGREWHQSCFRCAGCQQPFGAGGFGSSMQFSVGDDGQAYHPACHKQLFHPRCSVCEQYIPSNNSRIEWRENPFWKERHCPAHSSDGTPQCCACSRLQKHGEEWVPLHDGRQLCLQCLHTIVVDTKDAQPLYDEILQFFKRMGMAHEYRAPLMLVEGGVLSNYAAREGRRGEDGPVFHIRGLCVATVYTSIPSIVRSGLAGLLPSVSSVNMPTLNGRGVTKRCSVSCILVMYGLPRLLTGSIIAHELMHAYLRMRHVSGLPSQVEEGLCQLMALLWLDSQDAACKRDPQLERFASYLGFQIRTDTSQEYGEGFRMAYEAFQQRGLKALVEHVIAHGAFPA